MIYDAMVEKNDAAVSSLFEDVHLRISEMQGHIELKRAEIQTLKLPGRRDDGNRAVAAHIMPPPSVPPPSANPPLPPGWHSAYRCKTCLDLEARL